MSHAPVRFRSRSLAALLCLSLLAGASFQSPAAEVAVPAASAVVAAASGTASTVKAPSSKANEAASGKEAAAAAKESSSELLTELPASRVWIVLAVILLMAGLFWALLYFQQRIEQAGYFGRIYHDTFRGMESARLGAPMHDKWNKGAYLTDILLGRGQPGEDFHADAANKKPEAAEELRRLGKELGCEYEVKNILRQMDPTNPTDGYTGNPFSSEAVRRTSRTGMSGTSLRSGMAASLEQSKQQDAQSQQDREDIYARLRDDFAKQVDEWLSRASASAWNWYQEDLKKVEERAEDQANEALRLTDFSALRGRGPEFVLEFTAVVVIIFAAVILSVLGRLDNNQVGTLLAAIAGYVLGKGASRTAASPAAESSQQPVTKPKPKS
jgi:hypothetical protein